MKKFLKSKYFLAFWAILVIAFNAVLFLATNGKEKNYVFWTIYAFVMLGFVLMLVMRLFSTTATNLDAYVPLLVPVILVIILLGTIFFFFYAKLSIIGVVIPFVILLALFAVGFILAAYYAKSLKYIPEKKVVMVKFEQLPEFINDLESLCENENETLIIRKLKEIVGHTDLSEDNDAYKKEIFEYCGFLKKNLTKKEENNFYNNAEKVEYYLQKRG